MTNHKKTIKLFLLDGEPNGRIVGEISNWTGKAYRIPRSKVKDSVNRKDLHKTGVYILIGGNDWGEEKRVAYIGEAENVLQRLKQHLGEKEFWHESIVFLSKDDNLNKAHIKFLESILYEWAHKANRFKLANGNIPPKPSLAESDEAEMEEFADYIRLLTGTLGYRIFEPVLDYSAENVDSSEVLFSLGKRKSEAMAHGKRSDDGFVVLKGSVINETEVPSFPEGYRQLKDKLLGNKVIEKRNGKFVFTQDYLFSSPSSAASLVLGTSANGLVQWKNSQGKTLKEVETAEVGNIPSIE